MGIIGLIIDKQGRTESMSSVSIRIYLFVKTKLSVDRK